jgi:hypothetical protein
MWRTICAASTRMPSSTPTTRLRACTSWKTWHRQRREAGAADRGPHGKGIREGRGGRRRNGPVFAERSPVVGRCSEYSGATVLGRARAQGLRSARVFQYINETALFKNQWQLKTASQSDYLRLVEEKFRPFCGSWRMKLRVRGCLNRQWCTDTSLLRRRK